jgi:hypothetical protein
MKRIGQPGRAAKIMVRLLMERSENTSSGSGGATQQERIAVVQRVDGSLTGVCRVEAESISRAPEHNYSVPFNITTCQPKR